MLCSKCRTNNPPGNNFCIQCGNALMRPCAQCGAENPPASNFCGKCGARLAQGEGSSAVTPSSPESGGGVRGMGEQSNPPPTTDGERKTVTALFADIKGSTELMR